MKWHLLDVNSIWMKEFASALSKRVPLAAWSPVIRNTGIFETWEVDQHLPDPPLTFRQFPLQRGYSRWPLDVLAPFGSRLVKMLSNFDPDAASSPLICTTPYYAPAAELWPGPVIYYQTDLTEKYEGLDPVQIRSLDKRLCRVAGLVCPNSQRVADYMISKAACEPSKIVIVPNATREANVFPACPSGPSALPADVADMPRPIAGVIGNLAGNMDWDFLDQVISGTPEYSWVFVGPTTMAISEADQSHARQKVLQAGNRVRFVGAKPYGELQAYARAFDVAVLPYRLKEPTYSGSSTRFYEHLSACRPMIATLGFEELLHKEPLLNLAPGADVAIAQLESLRTRGFQDGQEESRWQASRVGTWEYRADTMIRAFDTVGKNEGRSTDRALSHAIRMT